MAEPSLDAVKAGTASEKTSSEVALTSAPREPETKWELIIQNMVPTQEATEASPEPYSAFSLFVALLAALGIGSIVAAVISRWNTISQLRQAWIEQLRQDLTIFFMPWKRLAHAWKVMTKPSFGSAETKQ